MADQDGDAAQAFDALRASVEETGRTLGNEMTTIRKGVEAAFEQLEAQSSPPDYGPELGRVVQQISALGTKLDALAQSPILQQGAEHQAAVLSRAGAGLVKAAADKLETQAGDLERITGNLGRQLGQVRDRREQKGWLWSAAATGMVAGILVTLFAPRVLPTIVGAYAASTILGDAPWQAGAKLMSYASPEGWSQMSVGYRLTRENAEAIGQCQKMAAETKREQRCTITVRN